MTDKDRMDFLERMADPAVSIKYGQPNSRDDAVFELFTVPSQHVEAATLREAIDLAMQYESGKRCWMCENWPRGDHRHHRTYIQPPPRLNEKAEGFTQDDADMLRHQADWYEKMTPDVVYACPEDMKPAWQLRNLADRIEAYVKGLQS